MSVMTQHMNTNVPQAWAVGSVFHFLQAILSLQADAPHRSLSVEPQLPSWLPELTLHALKVGNARLKLEFWLMDDRTYWDTPAQSGDVEIRQQSWQP
jgi:hypothetical protein